jgi:glycine cleavage system H protein
MAIEKFSKDHEWIRIEGDIGIVGITRHAQDQLGDIVFVEAPVVGRKVAANEAVAVVESVKAASDVFSPVSGEVVEANGELGSAPALVNEDPEGRGWFYKVQLSNKSELDGLMDRAAYDAFVKESA